MGLFKLLGDNQGKSLTACDLAGMSGYDQVFVGEYTLYLGTLVVAIILIVCLLSKARVMRMMTAIGWASEIGNQTYTANTYTICQTQAGAEGGFIISYVLVHLRLFLTTYLGKYANKAA